MVTVVYNGSHCFCFENVELCKQYQACDSPCDIFSRTLEFVICGPNPKMCLYADVSNQDVFQIPFPKFILEAKCKALCTQVVEMICD
jgi:hypothetical protein